MTRHQLRSSSASRDGSTVHPQDARGLDRRQTNVGRTGSGSNWALYIEEDDPFSAVAEPSRTATVCRDTWRVRIETMMRLSCMKNAFLLRASLRAWEGPDEGWQRD